MKAEIRKTEKGLPLLTSEQTFRVLNNSLSAKKGVLVLGITGSGKTTLFKNWIEIIKNKSIVESPVFLTADEIVMGYEIHGPKYFQLKDDPKHNNIAYCFDKQYKRPIYIDDLGTERPLRFGNGILLDSVLKDLFDSGINVYISSNLSLEELRDLYGDRILSRIKGQCGIIVIDNPDYRELEQEEIRDLLLENI